MKEGNTADNLFYFPNFFGRHQQQKKTDANPKRIMNTSTSLFLQKYEITPLLVRELPKTS